VTNTQKQRKKHKPSAISPNSRSGGRCFSLRRAPFAYARLERWEH